MHTKYRFNTINSKFKLFLNNGKCLKGSLSLLDIKVFLFLFFESVWKEVRNNSMLRLVISLVGSGNNALNENHTISSPLSQSSSTPRKKRSPSILASAFQNAWKMGNLTEGVSGSLIIYIL